MISTSSLAAFSVHSPAAPHPRPGAAPGAVHFARSTPPPPAGPPTPAPPITAAAPGGGAPPTRVLPRGSLIDLSA